MTDKRFRCVFKEHETKNSWSMIKDNQLDKPLYIKDVVDLLNELSEENKYLKKRIKVISDELYCKDRKLEELGVHIECCDKR